MLNGVHQHHCNNNNNNGNGASLNSHFSLDNNSNRRIGGGGGGGEGKILQTCQISPQLSARDGVFSSSSHPPSTAAEESRHESASSWSVGTEVIALYSFAGKSSEDLPFHKGDILVITALTKDPNWCRARRKTNNFIEGMIPSNYVKRVIGGGGESVVVVGGGGGSPNGLPWFHGFISREEAESRLKAKPNGAYLVRESTNFPGDYTLCIAYEAKVEHYRIIRQNNNTLTCDEEEFFDNLPKLIEHYTLDSDGLCCRLSLPVVSSDAVSAGRPPLPVDTIGTDVVDCAANLPQPVSRLPSRVTKIFDASWTINRHDLKLGDTIGKGEFGDVLVGWYKGEKVAVKGLRQSNQVVKAMLEEAELMTSLRHKHLVRLLGVVTDEPASDVYLVMEYMVNGSLIDYLRTRGRQQVTKRQQINFACDVCEGMAYLESNNLVHRDLAARNILLAEDMTAKVSDFGLAKPVDVDKPDDASGKFPIKWTAPEALRLSKFTCKSDVWSFGILLWEIYSFGRVPYPRIPVQEVVRYIENGYRMEAPEGCPPEITAIMKETWCPDSQKRPSFKQLLTRLRDYQSTVPS